MLFSRPTCVAKSVICAALLYSGISPSVYGQPEDEDYLPGLLARYESGDAAIERVEQTLSFDWGAAPPDERLPVGDFTARWTGNLLVRSPGTHTFHVFLAGRATISIDGQRVLSADHGWGFESGQPVDLSAGDHEIEVTYSTPEESDKPRAKLAVFWSSDKFTLEPLSADVLFRDETSLSWIDDHGRRLKDAFRCASCHKTNSGLAKIKAPSLDRVNGSQAPETLVKRLMRPEAVVANSHMPHFGFSQKDAENVAAFLKSTSKKAHSNSEIKAKEGDVSAGNRLLNSLGCVVCHRLPTAEKIEALSKPYEGPELIHLSLRRSPDRHRSRLRLQER